MSPTDGLANKTSVEIRRLSTSALRWNYKWRCSSSINLATCICPAVAGTIAAIHAIERATPDEDQQCCISPTNLALQDQSTREADDNVAPTDRRLSFSPCPIAARLCTAGKPCPVWWVSGRQRGCAKTAWLPSKIIFVDRIRRDGGLSRQMFTWLISSRHRPATA